MWGPGRLALACLGSGSQRPFQPLRGLWLWGAVWPSPQRWIYAWGPGHTGTVLPLPRPAPLLSEQNTYKRMLPPGQMFTEGPRGSPQGLCDAGTPGSLSSHKAQRPLACTPEPSSEWVGGHRRTQGPACDSSERLLVHDPFSPVSAEGRGSIPCTPAVCWAPGAFFHLPDLWSREVSDGPISQKRKTEARRVRMGSTQPSSCCLLFPVQAGGPEFSLPSFPDQQLLFVLPRLADGVPCRALCAPGHRRRESCLEPTFGSAFSWHDWIRLDE